MFCEPLNSLALYCSLNKLTLPSCVGRLGKCSRATNLSSSFPHDDSISSRSHGQLLNCKRRKKNIRNNFKRPFWRSGYSAVRALDSGQVIWGWSPGRSHFILFLDKANKLSYRFSSERCEIINGYRRNL